MTPNGCLPPGVLSVSSVPNLSDPVIAALQANNIYISGVGQPGGPIAPGTVYYDPENGTIYTPTGSMPANAYLASQGIAPVVRTNAGAGGGSSNAPITSPSVAGAAQSQPPAQNPPQGTTGSTTGQTMTQSSSNPLAFATQNISVLGSSFPVWELAIGGVLAFLLLRKL